MANEQNLMPPFESPKTANGSERDASINGKKGGINSAKSKKIKKTIAETTKDALYRPVTDERQLEVIRKSGMVVARKPTYLDFLVASVLTKTIRTGRLDDLKKLMEIVGEEPPNMSNPIDEIEEDILSASLRELAEKGLEDD